MSTTINFRLALPLDSTSNFQELLSKRNSVSVHETNLQLLLTEIYKTIHNVNPTFMTQVFEEKDVSYTFRANNSLALPKAKTMLYGIGTVRKYIGEKLWQTLPTEIKASQSLESFKQKMYLVRLQLQIVQKFCSKPRFHLRFNQFHFYVVIFMLYSWHTTRKRRQL